MSKATWTVILRDGSEVHQHDATHPLFTNGEIPYRNIDWANVDQLVLESQFCQQALGIEQVPPEYAISLRSRHYGNLLTGDAFTAFIVCVSEAGREVTEETCVSAFYWFANGVTHQCDSLNCPETYQYAANWLHDGSGSLMPEHNTKRISVDAHVESPA